MSSDEKGDDDAEYREEKELEEEEESEEKADKDDEEEEEGRSKGATQARKVKLSLVVSESSWKYVMPNLFRVTCEKSGWFLRKDDNPKAIFDTFVHIYMDACIYIYINQHKKRIISGAECSALSFNLTRPRPIDFS